MLEFISRRLDLTDIFYQSPHRRVDADTPQARGRLYSQAEDGNTAGDRQVPPIAWIAGFRGKDHGDQDAMIACDLELCRVGTVRQFADKGVERGIARGLNQYAAFTVRSANLADHLDSADPLQLGRR